MTATPPTRTATPWSPPTITTRFFHRLGDAAKGKHIIHCLTIIGQIEGHYILPPQNKTTKYEHVIPNWWP
jgi:hypothetical protein